MSELLFDLPDSQETIPSAPEGWVSEVLPPSGERLKIEVDYKRVDEVLSLLMDLYQRNEPPYNTAKVPHHPEHMPSPEVLPRGTTEHAMFLWTVCYYMRGGIKSNDAVKRLSRLYEDRPELFDCNLARLLEPEDIKADLTSHGLGFRPTVSRAIVENAKRMYERFDGDPRKIFEGVDTYEDILERVKNDSKGGGFLGFQEKMTSMIMYFMIDEGLVDLKNFPIPIDFHVLRISVATEMIKFPEAPHGTNLYTPETLAVLRDVYYNYTVKNGLDPCRMSEVVWLYSSALCGDNPGNTTLEPHGRGARKGKMRHEVYLAPVIADPNNPSHKAAYEKSCGSCLLDKDPETCAYNIPGTTYYVAGAAIIRSRRKHFPGPDGEQGQLQL